MSLFEIKLPFPVENLLGETFEDEEFSCLYNELKIPDKNWFLSEEENKWLSNSETPDIDFHGMDPQNRIDVLRQMKDDYLLKYPDVKIIHPIDNEVTEIENDEFDDVTLVVLNRSNKVLFSGTNKEYREWKK